VPALVSGAVWGSGHTLISNGRGDLTLSAAARMAPRLWAMADAAPADVEVACLYDAFTPLVLQQLEDYGFCAKGDAAAFYAGTQLPINTHGGHLSEGYVHGLNHAAEAVQRVRAGAALALSTGQPGYVAGNTSAVVLRRAA
jgi:acetyl-CoA acetyltransferase